MGWFEKKRSGIINYQYKLPIRSATTSSWQCVFSADYQPFEGPKREGGNSEENK